MMIILEDTRQQAETKKTWKIYRHISPDGKIYVGRTTAQKLHQRTGLNGNRYKQNKEFYADIQKYGWNSFAHEILDVCKTEEESMALEIKYIAMYDSTNPLKGYNKSVGGYPCNKGLTDQERKERQKKCSDRWKENNREKYLEIRRKNDRSNARHKWANAWNKTPERRKKRTEYMKKYRESHREKIREYNRKSQAKRKLINEQSDPNRHKTEAKETASQVEREVVC